MVFEVWIVWTPRRILMFILGLFLFGAAYVGYARIFGAIDGLPILPEKFLEAIDTPLPPPVYGESPTITRLKDAFGQNCAEVESSYPTRLEQRDQGIVIAAGRPDPIDNPSRFVRLAPFSLAQFGKPKAGEVTEVTTQHSDEAILELDRPIGNERELIGGKAKIIGMELRAVPNTTARTDPRNGRVIITNNQQSADPNKFFVFKTPGPVFYRTQDHPDIAANPNAPHIWTSAEVEIVNRDNQPRPIRGRSLPTVPLNADDVLTAKMVADMALGVHTPPPTITAEGMKIYLKPSKPDPTKPQPKGGTGFSGVREMILNENVKFNLWSDGNSSFLGSNTKPEPGKPTVQPSETPLGLLAMGGGLIDGMVTAKRLQEKSLVRIRTLGTFHYDWEKNLAHFDIAPQANPLLPNNVEVTRMTCKGGRDHLVCQKLEIEFNGPIGRTPNAPPPDKTKPPQQQQNQFKNLRATGPSVYLASETEQLQTFGTALIHENLTEQRITRSTLRGAPLVAVRQGNRLTTGSAATSTLPEQVGTLILESIEPAPNTKDVKTSRIHVDGPGKIDLFDELTRTNTMTASWTNALSQYKDKVGTKDCDLLVFAGDGRFSDPKTGFDLKADTLKLWLEAEGTKSSTGSMESSKPARIQGIGRVEGKSETAIIENTDLLDAIFKDVPKAIRQVATTPPPAPVAPLASPLPPTSGPPAPLPPSVTIAPPKYFEPTVTVAARPSTDPPMKLSARKIDATIARSPVPANPKEKDSKPGVRYEIDKAECQDRVIVHQDSPDPKKSPNGTHITGVRLLLDQLPAGHVMKVYGTNEQLAFVQFEDTTIIGPDVDIHQPDNRVTVKGRGTLKMPSSTDLAGTPLGEKAEMHVAWQQGMNFRGELRSAEFNGQVVAKQLPPERKANFVSKIQPPAGKPSAVGQTDPYQWSYVICHRMSVTFDKPIYFNQMEKARNENAKKKPGEQDDAKVERVLCEPEPEDSADPRRAQQTGNYVYFCDETFDRKSNKQMKGTRITSKYLDVQVQEKRTVIHATGPGETRTLGMGSKDTQNQPTTPLPAGQKAEEELKLTVVLFAERLMIEDQKQVFQKAIYTSNVRAFHIPAENIDVKVNEHAAPERSIVIKCTDKMTATSYQNKAGQEDRRTLEAVGEARVRTDDYDGNGHTIDYDGTFVILRALGDGQATMYRRQTGVGRTRDFKSGNPITYNVKTKTANVNDSTGGAFTNLK